MSHRLFPLLLFISLLGSLVSPLAAQTLTWTNVTPMNTARVNAAAVVLNDGKVLVTGGRDASNNVLSTAERYDPVADTWTTISMVAGRWLHRAEKLADGRVLVIAGAGAPRNALNTAEIYDPATGTFSAVTNLAESRETFASTVLSNGKVLVHGGWVGGSVRSSGEVYDPVANTWTATGASVPRNSHELVTLPNGKVLMISGHTGAVHGPPECYLYDPAANTWTATGSMGTGRAGPRSVILANGKVLTTGESATCELYDPATGTWSYTGSMSVGRGRGHAILLGDGRVLAFGGGGSFPAMPVSSEIYNPATGTWSATGSAASGRTDGVAVRLQSGVVLAAGGSVGTSAFSAPASANVAIFDAPAPPPPPAPTVTAISPNTGATAGGTSVTITGTDFTGATGVTIGGAAATSVVVSNATTITAVTPAGSAGTASVVVTTASGSNAANTLYTYVPPSLVSWYRAEGNTVDTVGANPGTAQGGLTYAAGQSGQAFDLNGGSAVNCGNNASLQLSNGTISAWIKTSNAGAGYRGIVVKQSAYGLFMLDNVLVGYDWSTNSNRSTGVSLNDNQWHHVAFTFQAGVSNGSKIYIDGTLSSAFTWNVNGQGVALSIGAGYENGALQNFTGLIDEAQVYSSALSATDIQNIYTAGGGVAAPTVTAISPTSGSTAGGTSVTITGTNFSGTPSVTIGSVAATSVVVVDANTITCLTPAGTGTNKDVVVTVSGEPSTGGTGIFSYQAPTVASISPTSGSTAGGTSVTITGTNFGGTPTVTIGGVAATSVVVNSATSITCTTPAGTAGARDVVVTVTGQSSTGGTSLYTYVVPNSAPTITSNSGGPTATINVLENTTAVTTVVATDTDLPAQTITYSKSGTHAGLFNIQSGSGVLTFAAAPDFETGPGPFSVTVIATDDGSPNLSDSQDLTISVLNVNDTPPAGTDKTITVNEGATYTFLPADFGFTDPLSSPPDNFKTLRISTLPSAGALSVGGVPAVAGDTVTPSTAQAGAVLTERVNSVASGATPGFTTILSSGDGIKIVANSAFNSYLRVSTDGGVNWVTRNNLIGFAELLALSRDGSKLIARSNISSDTWLNMSTDDGQTWTQLTSAGSRNWTKVVISANGQRIAAAVGSGYIHTSIDGGSTWTQQTASGTSDFWSSLVASDDGMRITAGRISFAGVNQPLLTSTDGGVTWAQPSPEIRDWRTLAGSADGLKLVIGNYSPPGRIFTSVDGGANWTERANSSSTSWSSLASSADGLRLFALGGHLLETSSDGGATWTSQSLSVLATSLTSPNALTVSSDGSRLAITDYFPMSGRVWTSVGASTTTPTLTYTAPSVSANATPLTSFTFQVEDDGSTANGGQVLDLSPNTISINVLNTNNDPTDITLTPASIAENNAANATVGTLAAVDTDLADSHLFTFVTGTGDTDNASFTIIGTNLTLIPSADFETKASYSIRVQADDGNGGTFAKAMTVTITNVNEAPTVIGVAGKPSGLAAWWKADGNANDSSANLNHGTAQNGAGFTTGRSGQAFSLNGTNQFIQAPHTDSLSFSSSFTVESWVYLTNRSNHYMLVTKTSNGLPGNYEVRIAHGSGLIDLGLLSSGLFFFSSNAAVPLNQWAHVAVVFTAGTGVQFYINGAAAGSASTTGLPSVNSDPVRIGARADGFFLQGQIDDLALYNRALNSTEIAAVSSVSPGLPTGSLSLAENAAAGTSAGTLASLDPDSGDAFTYSLVSGTGDSDNASFTIDGTQVRSAAVFDFETKPSYSVRVRATDAGGLFTEEALTVAVTNVNEAPTDIALSANVIAENNAANATVGTLSTVGDPDAGAAASTSYSIVSGAGDTDNAAFNISGNALRLSGSANFEAKSSYSVRVQANDGANTLAKAFTVTVTNVNDAPVITSNGGGATGSISIAENTTAVTTVIANDIDLPAQTITYSKSGTHAGLFNIDGGTGALTFAAAPDFETGPGPFSVTVIATDDGSPNLSDSQDLTISVTNADDSPTISDVTDKTTNEDVATTAIPFTIGDQDAGTTFNVSATSSNTTLVPNGNVVLGGSGTSRTATITPAANLSGTTLITLTVSDGTLSASDTFTLTVNSVNDAPSFAINSAALTGVNPGILAYGIGTNGYGQLGANSGANSSSVAVPVANVSDFIQVSSGDYHSIGLASDGSVWGWGRNDAGQLANGVAVDDGSPNSRSRIPLRVAGLSDVVQVDAGFSWNMALKADGSVWTWGINSAGQLGLGATSGPVLTPTNVPGLTGIQKIVAAGGTAYALKSDGTLWTWGVNGNGQLGRGTAGVNEATPAVVTALGSTVARLFTAVSAHVFVERTDGTIWTWGTNYFGQGGTGASEVLSNTTPTQVTALGAHQVLTMAAGQSNSFAVMNDGTVKGFGANHNGFELGLGGGSAIQTTPVTVPGLTNIVAVSAGAGGVALNASGNVFSWGLTGTPSAPSTPTQVASLSNITAVSCGQNFILMLGTPPPMVFYVVVTEDTGAQSVSNVVNNVSPGPADESAQTVNFTVTNTHNALFSVQPAISSNGTLTYTLAPNANGLATISVTAVDDGGTANGGVNTSAAQTFPIKVTPVNDTPTDIVLSASAIAENNAANATVGTLSTTDVDVGDAFIYALVTGAGSTDNGSFTIAGNALKLTPSANFELKNSYAIRVRSTDTGTQSFEKELTINITDVNEAPTNIALSSNTLLENNTPGAAIGNFSASDVDAGQTHSFALVSGTGSTDNAAFTLSTGGALSINGSTDYETKTSYSIRVAATDNGALPLTFEKIFTINVLPVSESSPTAIGGTFTVAENAALNTLVGTLTATDADAGEVFTFDLVSGAGSTDNGSFNINGSTLRTNVALDFEAGTTHSIRVRVTDSGSFTLEQALTVTVTNVNEVPVFVKGASPSIPYTTAAKTVTGWATAINDGDSTVSQALSFTVTEVGSSGMFTAAPAINSSTGTLTYTPNGTSGTATFNVSLTDDNTINGNAALTTGTQQFTITVQPAPNYTVSTTGNVIVVTDVSGNGDTLTISEPSSGNIQFAAAGRTFSVDGDFNINGNSGSVPLAGVTSITVNTALGADTINVSAFATTLPALTINGGTGNDAVNLNGAIALAAANLSVDLGTDIGDLITVNATTTLTGTATLNAKTITLNADVTGTVTGSIATAVTVALPAQIQDGLNVAAATGALVQVGAGSYAEDISIDRSLTLRGAGAATTSIVGPIGGPRAVTVLFTGNASNSIFEGFTVTRAGNNPTDWFNGSLNTVGISIQFQTLSGITLRNNIVTGNRNGIDINDSNGHTIVNNVVSSNRTGLFFRNQTDNLVVEQNTITGNHTAGILFFPATTNGSFQQTAANCSFTNNNISGNWYGQVQERQAGGVIPIPGTTNLKNLSGNWFGTATPTIVSTNGTEPGYVALGVPVEFGGTAVPPVTPQPEIGGIASANLDITPLLASGADTNVETSPGRGTMGFQGNKDSLRVTADLAQTGATTRIQEGVNALAAVGTLAVATGSYTEDVNTSTKSVDLSAGASPGLVTVNGNFTLDSNDTLPVEVNASTPGTGFDQWIVNGSVNLGGATLSLSLGYTPAPNQSFILVNNDDTDTVSGTFNGIIEGATIIVGSLPFKISYIGGSGNDVEMTLLNTPPDITSNGGLATASISIPENTTALTTVTATDPEVPATQSLTYSKSGPDAALFNIGSSSGVLTFATAPDFEGTHGNTYYVTVIATDNGIGNLSDSQAITITVTDVTDPISSPGGDVVSGGGAPDATGADSGADFDVLKRGGFLAQNGTLVFPGNLLVGFGTPPVTLNDFQGIWKESGTGLKLIARTGTIAPGTTTATFNGLPNIPAISDNGDVTILGALNVGVGGTTVNNDTGLWTQVGSGTTPSTFKLLAREGAAIPGAGGGAYVIRKFASGAYATASITSTLGAVAYSATTVGGPDKTGIFMSLINNGTVTNSVALALEGNAAPGVSGQTFGALASSYSDPARMDAAGNVAFAAILRPSNKESLWYAPYSTGVATKIFFAGDTAPDTGGATFLNLKSQAMGGAGTVSFRGLLTSNTGDNTGNLKNDGIWRGTGSNVGTYTCILRRGDTNASRPGLNLPNAADKVGNLWHSWLTNANHGAWLGQFDAGGDGTSVPAPGDTYGIYTDLSGTMTLYLLYGDPAPGIAGASFNNIDLPIVGGQEQMVFIGKVSGGGVTASNDQGIWRSAPNGGALSLILRTGDSMTTTNGTKTVAKVDFPGSNSKARQWEQPVMDSTGRVLIFVTFTDGTTSQIIAP